MKNVMIAKNIMTDLKGVVIEFKKLKKGVCGFVKSSKSKLVISNDTKTKSTVIYFLSLSSDGVELVVKSSNSEHVTYLNFNNGDIYSTLYKQPVRCMKYLTHFVQHIFSDLTLGKAEIKKNRGVN
jgi:hypothetical protein